MSHVICFFLLCPKQRPWRAWKNTKEEADLSLFQEKCSCMNYGYLDSSCGHIKYFLQISVYSLHLETMLYTENLNHNSKVSCISKVTCPHKDNIRFWSPCKIHFQHLLQKKMSADGIFFLIIWIDIKSKSNLVFLLQLHVKLTGDTS